MLYKGTSHIYAETVTAHPKPKAHNVFQLFKCSFRPWRVHRLLPFSCRVWFIKAVIQSWLMRKKVYSTGTVSVRNSTQACHTIRLNPDRICPDITVGVFIFAGLHRFLKPLMLGRSMTRNKVQQNMHTALMNLKKKPFQIFISSVAGSGEIIIRNIITRVAKRRSKTGIHPDCITAKLFDVIKLLNYSIKVTDSISV